MNLTHISPVIVYGFAPTYLFSAIGPVHTVFSILLTQIYVISPGHAFKMLSTARRHLNPCILKVAAKTKTLKNDKLIQKPADLQVIACCIGYQRFRAVWSELRKRSRNNDMESITLLVCKQLLLYLIY